MNSPIQTASEFRRGCLQRWLDLTRQFPDGAPQRLPGGKWSVSYALALPSPPAPIPLADLRAVLKRAQGSETGWPPFMVAEREDIKPKVVGGIIQCSFAEARFDDPSSSDFWSASPTGEFFVMRGYQEDSKRDFEPRTVFDLTIPIWRLGEVLLHAARVAKFLLQPNAVVGVVAHWDGLDGRVLRPWANPNRVLFQKRMCEDTRYEVSFATNPAEIERNLSELLQRHLADLYARFDFFVPPPALFAEEVAQLRADKKFARLHG